jgi:hypothetical protein
MNKWLDLLNAYMNLTCLNELAIYQDRYMKSMPETIPHVVYLSR